MYTIRKGQVWASEIADFLNKELVGSDFIIVSGATSDRPSEKSVIFAEGPITLPVEGLDDLLIICNDPYLVPKGFSYIVSDDAKLDFVHALLEFFIGDMPSEIDGSARIKGTAKIGRGVHIGSNAVLGDDVVIGDKTAILANVVIHDGVTIGSNCVIKSGAIIGSEGYSFVTDRDGRPLHAPQLGAVLLGDNVWVGSNSTIERGAFGQTHIYSDVKIDDLVHIGGGSIIGSRSMVTAGVVIGTKVGIGSDCWLAPNVSVRQEINIGDKATIGLGSVVIHDLLGGFVYAGVPAKKIR